MGFLLLPVGGVGLSLAQDDRDPAELLEDGREAYQREEFEKAREDLWAYLDATASLTGASRMPQAEALYYIALMEPDASVAARHYQIIADEFPAASVADQAIFRLAQYELVQNRPAEARALFVQVRQNYPYSRLQAELPMWIGRTHLDENAPREAADEFLAGFTKVKSGEVPQELPRAQSEALAAEYAWWLAAAHEEAGDAQTATQYYSLLTLDYPDSPQAAQAREALAARGVLAAAPEGAAEEVAMTETVRDEPPAAQPVREAPREQLPREEPPPREEEVVVQPVRPAPADPREAEVREAEVREAEVREEEVREEEVREEEVRPPPPEPRPVASSVYIQIGAFTSATNAAELSKRLKSDGFEPAVAVGIVDGRGYYRVRIGPFLLPEAAQRLAAVHSALGSLGYPARQVSEN